ncbi:MAG: isoleucine--tRNA ligase [Candidatus Kariarchaeaceae archaeon]
MTHKKNKPFTSVSPDFNLPELENKMRKFWKKEKIYEKTQELRSSEPKFRWVEGPPTANGEPHVGHIITRCYKDLILRFKTMSGFQVVPRTGGWDTHGLPVEVEVEKELGFESKQDILDYGMVKFNQKCRASVFKYETEWKKMTERNAFWLDMDNSYITLEDNYIESVWWSLKTLWDQGLLYKGWKILPWCPRCGTSLSSHEVGQGYKDVEDPAITVRFKSVDMENTWFLAWTTTPWTLISNVALSVHPDFAYVIAEKDGTKYILAEELVESVLGEGWNIEMRISGQELEGKSYEPLFPWLAPTTEKKGFFVTVAEYVTLDEGTTGIVHSAPAFGADDAEIGTLYNLPSFNPVLEDGTFKEIIKPFAGMFVKDADEHIIKMLDERGDLIKEAILEHSYPFCWRCDSPLIYYGRDSWFIKMSSLREELLENNAKINWVPKHIKNGRFGNFLDTVVDWSLSRSRFWGTPLPIWTCPKGHFHCVGSKEELVELTGKPLSNDFELHRPWVDEIFFDCPECNEKMTREEYVIDCWYDSGSAPFAQYHYPFENKELFDEHFPFDFISEAVDQTRGWFYSLLAISTALFKKPSYMNCVVFGHILDDKGVKMSKSKGNAISTDHAFDTEGSDAIRWYLFSTPVWNPSKFSLKTVSEVRRRAINTFWNVYSFFVNNANTDKFTLSEEPIPLEKRPKLDQWLVQAFNKLALTIKEELDNYKAHNAIKALDFFIVESLSNWYVRRSRRRFWKEDIDDEKESAYQTLYEVIVGLAKLLAPFIPYIAENVYQNLVRGIDETALESVHMERFPEVEAESIDLEMLGAMENVIAYTSAARAARSSANLKVRQPLSFMALIGSEEILNEIRPYEAVFAEELNVKEVSFAVSSDQFTRYELQPNFKALAPRVKSLVNPIKEKLATLSVEEAGEIVAALEAKEEASLIVNGEEVLLYSDDVEVVISEVEGYVSERVGSTGQAILNTQLTPELIKEGLSREVTRRIQEMRKQMDLEYTQKIDVVWASSAEEAFEEMFETHGDYIKKETLSLKMEKGTPKEVSEGFTQEWKINDYSLTLNVIGK